MCALIAPTHGRLLRSFARRSLLAACNRTSRLCSSRAASPARPPNPRRRTPPHAYALLPSRPSPSPACSSPARLSPNPRRTPPPPLFTSFAWVAKGMRVLVGSLKPARLGQPLLRCASFARCLLAVCRATHGPLPALLWAHSPQASGFTLCLACRLTPYSRASACSAQRAP